MNHGPYTNISRIKKMDIYTINYIKNNPLIYNYLREDSTWYKKLNRDSAALKELEIVSKKFYKETPEDKLEKISRNIKLISSFIDVLK